MRKSHEPTTETRSNVKALASVGTTQEHIAIYLGIDVKTLRKHYRRELDTSLIIANSNVAKSLYKNANDGNVTAQIFWLKTKGGWSEKKSQLEAELVQLEIDRIKAEKTLQDDDELTINIVRVGSDENWFYVDSATRWFCV